MEEIWSICNKTGDFDGIMRSFGVSDITSRLLVNRGLCGEKDIRAFLKADISDIASRKLMKDVEKAASILREAVDDFVPVRIVGDYDVDGICSTYILFDALSRLGIDVDYYIPSRVKDGYGLNMDIIEDAANDGVEIILTCDNGSSAVSQIERAHELSMRVIVTDHHDLPDVLPVPDAFINPKQEDCCYPFKKQCGAVVAARLAEELYASLGYDPKEILDRYIEYMALATVCDVCELTGENRTIVRLGLEKMKHTDSIGLNALMNANSVDRSKLSAHALGFAIGPCLNATGRIDVADHALKLLLSSDDEEAKELAALCVSMNEERKEMTKEQTETAIEDIEADEELSGKRVLVIYLPDCHESIAGIIAGRLRERYMKPVIVLTPSGEGVKGSGRSIPAYNMFEELSKVKELFTKFGGHPMAAGMSLGEVSDVTRLRDALNERCSLRETDMCKKVLIDAVVPFGLFNEAKVRELSMLEPFGVGNSKPVFAEKAVLVKNAMLVGKTAKYLKMTLLNSYGREFDSIYFGDADEVLARIGDALGKEKAEAMMNGRAIGADVRLNICYYPEINEYRGKSSIQAVISSLKPASV